MISSKTLKEIVSEARPIIERQLDDAEMIAGLRDVVTAAGGDWSALKALIKAQIQDERDETGNGKRVKKILDKAGFSTDYASLLGWSNMNEKNFSADEDYDRETGEILEANPRLIKQVVDGMKTEAGRAALIAAVDILIEQEEAEDDQPETATETPKQVYGDSGAAATALPSQSVNIPAGEDQDHEIDGSDDRCLAEPHSQSDDDAIAEVNGSAGLANVVDVEPSSSVQFDPTEDRSEGQSLGGGLNAVGANTGGDDVDGSAVRADTSNTAGALVSTAPADGITYETAPKVGMKSLSYAHCFPELTKAEYQCLAGDITLNGVQEPIVRMGDIIVDGWNRYNAARSLGIEYPVRDYDGDDVLIDVINWQRSSRDWTSQQEHKIATALSKAVPHRAKDIWAAFHLAPTSNEVVAA